MDRWRTENNKLNAEILVRNLFYLFFHVRTKEFSAFSHANLQDFKFCLEINMRLPCSIEKFLHHSYHFISGPKGLPTDRLLQFQRKVFLQGGYEFLPFTEIFNEPI